MVTGSSATEYTAKVSKKFCDNASPEIEMFVSKDLSLAGGFKDLGSGGFSDNYSNFRLKG